MKEIKYDNCFVCGQNNPMGLKLSFEYDAETAFAYFDCPHSCEGYHGVIHGGIIATILDEAMAKIIITKGLIAVTADMNVKYRKPLPLGTVVKVSGMIIMQKTRTIHAKAVISGDDGIVYAESTAVYIVIRQLPES